MARKITIDKGIPVPENEQRHWPFPAMEIGDSFAVSREQERRVRAACSNYGKVHGKKFSVHPHDGAYRCWRVK